MWIQGMHEHRKWGKYGEMWSWRRLWDTVRPLAFHSELYLENGEQHGKAALTYLLEDFKRLLWGGGRVGDKGTSRESSWKVIAIIQARYDGGLDKMESQKWPDFGYISKGEPMRFIDGIFILDIFWKESQWDFLMGCRKKGLCVADEGFSVYDFIIVGAICWVGEPWRGPGVGIERRIGSGQRASRYTIMNLGVGESTYSYDTETEDSMRCLGKKGRGSQSLSHSICRFRRHRAAQKPSKGEWKRLRKRHPRTVLLGLVCGWGGVGGVVGWVVVVMVVGGPATSVSLVSFLEYKFSAPSQTYWIIILADGPEESFQKHSRWFFYTVKSNKDVSNVSRKPIVMANWVFLLESSVLHLVVAFWALYPQMSAEIQSDQLRNIMAEHINKFNQEVYNH